MVKRVTLWLQSWWITYVSMSRRERRDLLAIMNDPDPEFMDAPRPAQPTAAALEDGIILALRDSNIPAVGALLTQLAAVDPRRTRTLIDAMQTGIDAARK